MAANDQDQTASPSSTPAAAHARMLQLIERFEQHADIYLRSESTASGQAQEIVTRKCAALDRQIGALVYELYGLSDAEIALIEGRT